MDNPFRAKTLGEILGHDRGDSPEAMVFHRFLELNVCDEGQLRDLPQSDRYLWLVCRLEAEVQNGGIDHFLWNSHGDYTMETLEALQAIGAASAHMMLSEACALFPGGRPSEFQETRQEEMRAIRAHSEGKKLDDVITGDLDPNLMELIWDYHQARVGTGRQEGGQAWLER